MGFIRKFILGRDDGGYVTNEVPWVSLEQGQKIELEGGVEKTLAVPTWAFRIKFTVNPGATVWCGHGSTPLQQSESDWLNELSELNPIVRPAFDAGGIRISTLRFLAEPVDGPDAWVHVIFYGKNDSDLAK